ncbi:hypothetical protein BpHYR1_030518 [Brachionus plicatilis]|uniref:Uncharacterized protein n=1 Tax=Brachionus plicatilis TaxID=10195 RepID=A0A3M7QXL2_BRAPC|nr:hypothetical protein BpHYR1_030518 [Brachionus plicatilis]
MNLNEKRMRLKFVLQNVLTDTWFLSLKFCFCKNSVNSIALFCTDKFWVIQAKQSVDIFCRINFRPFEKNNGYRKKLLAYTKQGVSPVLNQLII